MRLNSQSRLSIALAGMLIFAVPAMSQAQQQRLGRLFSTPEERLQLDEIRREYEYGQAPEPEPEVELPKVEVKRGPTFSQFTINGVVLRSNGTGSTWVNGARVNQGEVTREGVRIEKAEGGKRVKIVLPSGADSIRLKAGQKIDVASGAVLEAYEYKGTEGSRNAFAGDASVTAGSGVAANKGELSLENAKKGLEAVQGAGDRLKKLLEENK